jgi:hypothetical protein
MVMAGRLRFYPSRLPIQSFRPWTDVWWHSPRVPRFIGCGLFLERTEFVWTCGSKEKQRYHFQHLWRQIVLTTVFATLSGFSDNALLSCEHSAKFGTVTPWSSHCEMRSRNVRPVGVSFQTNWKHSGQGMTKHHVWQYRTIQDHTEPYGTQVLGCQNQSSAKADHILVSLTFSRTAFVDYEVTHFSYLREKLGCPPRASMAHRLCMLTTTSN